MHIVSIFPSLFDYALFGPLILRSALGIFLCLVGFDVAKNIVVKTEPTAGTQSVPTVTEKNPNSIYGFIAFILGILLIIGLATQGAALLTIILILANSIFKGHLLASSNSSTETFIFAVVIALSLIVLGAGAPAVDLPL